MSAGRVHYTLEPYQCFLWGDNMSELCVFILFQRAVVLYLKCVFVFYFSSTFPLRHHQTSLLIIYSTETQFASSGVSQWPTLSFISRAGPAGYHVASTRSTHQWNIKIHLMGGCLESQTSADVDPGEREIIQPFAKWLHFAFYVFILEASV